VRGHFTARQRINASFTSAHAQNKTQIVRSM
jgi:hypothetical protein